MQASQVDIRTPPSYVIGVIGVTAQEKLKSSLFSLNHQFLNFFLR